MNLATQKQLDALLKHSGIDYTGQGLTTIQASKLIRQGINSKRNTVVTTKTIVVKSKPAKVNNSLEKEFVEYMKANMNKFTDSFNEEVLNVKAVIMNDTNYVKDDGKRFLMLGFGCAFVWLKFDKRSKLAQKIHDIAKKKGDYIRDLVKKELGKDVIKYLDKVGNPFDALWFQNVSLKLTYWHLVAKFCESKGVKNVRTDYRYD